MLQQSRSPIFNLIAIFFPWQIIETMTSNNVKSATRCRHIEKSRAFGLFHILRKPNSIIANYRFVLYQSRDCPWLSSKINPHSFLSAVITAFVDKLLSHFVNRQVRERKDIVFVFLLIFLFTERIEKHVSQAWAAQQNEDH